MSRISMLRDDDIIIDVNRGEKEAEISELYNILAEMSLRALWRAKDAERRALSGSFAHMIYP